MDAASLPKLAFPCQGEHLDALVVGVSYSNSAILEGAVSYTLEEEEQEGISIIFSSQQHQGPPLKSDQVHHCILLQVCGLA